MKVLLRRLWFEEEGQDLIEYALLAAFIALACMVALPGIRQGLIDLYNEIKTDVTKAAADAKAN